MRGTIPFFSYLYIYILISYILYKGDVVAHFSFCRTVGLSDLVLMSCFNYSLFPYEAFATFGFENGVVHLLGDGEGLVDEGWDRGIRVKS